MNNVIVCLIHFLCQTTSFSATLASYVGCMYTLRCSTPVRSVKLKLSATKVGKVGLSYVLLELQELKELEKRKSQPQNAWEMDIIWNLVDIYIFFYSIFH